MPRSLADERAAVIARIKGYVGLWQHDRRMKVMGEILLGEIARIEKDEADRSQREP
ncbi:MAG TPA: hypothetical protein VM370_09640 [Candidatus Thermoplasmatota archaeon]|nr:hypothetical protein [Candidatus Thermoplasmatota archaeon]